MERQEPRQNAAMMPQTANDLLVFFINCIGFIEYFFCDKKAYHGKYTK